ncbi:MAG: DUF4428 domain-containing protein [Erysipelotrichaceae bacterium]|nr:DUF4428 domain-containing protein [Erysipelotrichaceae bacterium]
MARKKAVEQNEETVATCSVCGKKLTRYGSKKLKDGVLCRNCAKLASDWLDNEDFARMSVDQIKDHLAYCQENLARIEQFKGLQVVEGKYSLYVDDSKREFVISKRDDLVKANADVFSLDQIKNMRIIERKYRQKEGSDIFVELIMDHPQFDNVRFQVNEFNCLSKDSAEYGLAVQLAYKYINAFKKRK